MAFALMVLKAKKITKLKKRFRAEKEIGIKVQAGEQVKRSLKTKYLHFITDSKLRIKKFLKRIFSFPEDSWMHRTLVKVKHDGTLENYLLKSIIGFIGGFFMIYIFFMFFVIILNWSLASATLACSIFGCICTVGLAFSQTVRQVVFLMLPQFFSKRGRQALIAYALILALNGPVQNTVNNMGILSESLACGQEQLKQIVKQIIELIKKPFIAIKEAIKKVINFVKKIVKKIKEIFLTIKRIVIAIVKVIKSVFQFLGKIFNICSKKVGTPFERCTRVFDNAITDCYAKLGPLFNWLCSIVYVIQYVCYIVKPLDFICMLLDFINTSVIGVIIRKIKQFVRHIRATFYVRIRFSHSFKFETIASKSMKEAAEGIVQEIRSRTKELNAIFDIVSGITSLFFFTIILMAVHYRFKFLTSERFDNKYITKYFRDIDFRRAKMGKEMLLPLNDRERTKYVEVNSIRLVQKEKASLTKALAKLSQTTFKLGVYIGCDYCLWWILDRIRFYGKYTSSVEVPRTVGLNVKGKGFIAQLLRSVVKAFNPLGTRMNVNSVPCLPDPIPPNYDKYIQIAFIIGLSWLLTVFEPYGLRLRLHVLNYYYPTRARQRAVWLYNHILRHRMSFLKFARRQLKKKFTGLKSPTETKVTFKEMLRSRIVDIPVLNFLLKPCLGEDRQETCVLCAHVFRPGDDSSPIRCSTPGCPGMYCEQCFTDLQNLCTICLDPIQYGDLTDVDEEKDSSDPLEIAKKEKRTRETAGQDLLSSSESGSSTEYSFSYQYNKNYNEIQMPHRAPFFDIEKQHIPDYVSMNTFHDYLFCQEHAETENNVSHKSSAKPRKLQKQLSSSSSDSENDEEVIFSRRSQSVKFLRSSRRKVKKWLEGKTMSRKSKHYQKDEEISLLNFHQSDEESSQSELPKSSYSEYNNSVDSEEYTELPQRKEETIQNSSMNYSGDINTKLNYLFPSVRYEEISEEQHVPSSRISYEYTHTTLTHRKKSSSASNSVRQEIPFSAENINGNSKTYKEKVRHYYKTIPRQTFDEESSRDKQHKIISFFSRLFRKEP